LPLTGGLAAAGRRPARRPAAWPPGSM